jgi:hypothetical protein
MVTMYASLLTDIQEHERLLPWKGQSNRGVKYRTLEELFNIVEESKCHI